MFESPTILAVHVGVDVDAMPIVRVVVLGTYLKLTEPPRRWADLSDNEDTDETIEVFCKSFGGTVEGKVARHLYLTDMFGGEPEPDYLEDPVDDSALPPSFLISQPRVASLPWTATVPVRVAVLVDLLIRQLLEWAHGNNRFVEGLAKLLNRLFGRRVVVSGSTSCFLPIPGQDTDSTCVIERKEAN